MSSIEKDFKTKLESLVSSQKISEENYKRFLERGIQFAEFSSDFPNLAEFFPDGVPIGASERFIEKLDFPYQETSYLCAASSEKHPRTFIYKTFGKGGGVVNLTGGRRPVGDNIFASLNRILLGNQAILVSADNLIVNSDQIWDWKFFGNNLKKDYQDVYFDLEKFSKTKPRDKFFQVVLARKKSTFERLGFLEKYMRKEIAIFDSQDTNVIILTNEDGFDYASKTIRPEESVHYISETDARGNIDIKKCMRKLRKEFGIKKMLNDGGRQMSDGMRHLGMLGGERVSYEPYPGSEFIPSAITDDMVLGREGIGIDGSEIEHSFVVFSQRVNEDREEFLKLHLYSI